MTLAVHGLACLGSFGPGLGDLLRKEPLPFVDADGLCPPGTSGAAGGQSPPIKFGKDGRAADADISGLKDRLPARALRQMDRFTRMALLCLLDALDDAGLNPDAGLPDTGIILATGYGPATPTFAFLDSLLAHGEQLASPLSFSHSVHNIPAASLALHFGLVGPCMTFCQPDNPVAAGFLAAKQWLDEGRVRRVLFGAVDEQTPLLARVSRRIAATRAASGCRTGLRAALPVSEGAVFFCLGPADASGRRGRITNITVQRGESVLPMQYDGETVFVSGAVPPAMATGPGRLHLGTVYGNIPVAQALDVAFALTDRQHVPSGRACCRSQGSHGETACIHVRQSCLQGDAL